MKIVIKECILVLFFLSPVSIFSSRDNTPENRTPQIRASDPDDFALEEEPSKTADEVSSAEMKLKIKMAKDTILHFCPKAVAKWDTRLTQIPSKQIIIHANLQPQSSSEEVKILESSDGQSVDKELHSKS